MHLLHLAQGNRPPELPDSDNLIGKIPPVPVSMSTVKLGIPQPVLFYWRITGIPRPGRLCFADMRNAGVRSGPVEPDT